jgi:hypothetical protein
MHQQPPEASSQAPAVADSEQVQEEDEQALLTTYSTGTSLAYCTNYPRLFEQTYWGSVLFEDCEKAKHAISNRNRFVQRFGLRRFVSRMRGNRHALEVVLPAPHDKMMDHQEMYADGNGLYFSVISPYEPARDDLDLQDRHGYYRHPSMYQGAQTYVKMLPAKKGGDIPPQSLHMLRTVNTPESESESESASASESPPH